MLHLLSPRNAMKEYVFAHNKEMSIPRNATSASLAARAPLPVYLASVSWRVCVVGFKSTWGIAIVYSTQYVTTGLPNFLYFQFFSPPIYNPHDKLLFLICVPFTPRERG